MTPPAEVSTPDLNRWLAWLCQRRQRANRQAAALRLTWLAAAGLLAMLLADASVALPVWVRLTTLAALAAVGAAAAVSALRLPRNASVTAQQRLARELDRTQHAPRAHLLNAILLANRAACDADPLARALARRSVRQGEAAMRAIDPAVAVDGEAVRREGGRWWAVAVAWLVVLAVQPGVIGRGMERVMLPWAEVPAFSLTQLTVTVAPAAPMAGDDVQVDVRVAGVMPDASPRVVEAGVGEARRWTMRSTGAGDAHRWTHTFRMLREPVRFRVEAGGAMSRWQTVRPGSAEPTATNDAQADAAGPARDAAPPETAGPPPAADASTLADHLASLHSLIQQAAALRDLANELTQASGLDATTAEAMHAALHADMAAFTGEAAALADAVATLAAAMDEPVRGDLLALAARLENMAVSAELATDAANIRDAAEADRAALAAQGEGLADRLAGELSHSDERDRPTAGSAPAAQGTYDVTMEPGSPADAAALRAIAEQAPPAYRTLVERYFRSLQEDRYRE